MNKLDALKKAKTKSDFADILGINIRSLTYCLYKLKTENQYKQFKLPKKSGGERTISAPMGRLKSIQKALSVLLQDCLDEIYAIRFPYVKKKNLVKPLSLTERSKRPSLSHGFERNRSILTNAHMHLGKRNVLNIDLEDFFGSFNFGRVRGFFIKNKNFLLNPEIATIIAQIACYQNRLPQGSPCSPVITNLITHSLDIRLAHLAHKNACTYTRYADDITFSSRKKIFPETIAKQKNNQIFISKKLRSEIHRAGFNINNKKTRLQCKDSRQDVTGLIVNKKTNTKSEYWRLARAQCDRLFETGRFVENINGEKKEGNINRLDGKLNFIDIIDHCNRICQNKTVNSVYCTKNDFKKSKEKKLFYFMNSREKIYKQFLFYKLFYANKFPAILTEGKTDIIHLKAAIQMLASNFPKLAKVASTGAPYQLLLHFIKYTGKTEFFLNLYKDGGVDCLKEFISNYSVLFSHYNAPKPKNPVIIIVDNDEGANNIASYLNKKNYECIAPEITSDVRQSDFVHIIENLYIIFLPRGDGNCDTDIEYFYTDQDRLRQFEKRCFNTHAERNKNRDLDKITFAKEIISCNKKDIDFHGFEQILKRIEMVIDHYKTL